MGCGNGYVASLLARLGYRVIGVDVSEDGIALARQAYPEVLFMKIGWLRS
jgi:2-polyprenyl-6-hydroxyphenyl methylase/3-demethylubiquinone-9 3-methyltransferase